MDGIEQKTQTVGNIAPHQAIDDSSWTLLVNKVNKVADDAKFTNDKTLELQDAMKEHRALLIIGFVVLLVMVATMFIATASLGFEVVKSLLPSGHL